MVVGSNPTGCAKLKNVSVLKHGGDVMESRSLDVLLGAVIGMILACLAFIHILPTEIKVSEFETANAICANNAGLSLIKVYANSNKVYCMNRAQFDVKR